MRRGIAGSLMAVSLALTSCADQQGWFNEGPAAVYGGGYGPAYGYDYAPYPPAGGFIVGGFGSDYDGRYRHGEWWRREHPDWSQADAQRHWQFQQQKAQNEALYRQRALQWEQQQKQQQAAAQWQHMQKQAVLQQRAQQWQQQQNHEQAMRQWGLMQQEWKRQHPGQ
jgi:hypothetical protein